MKALAAPSPAEADSKRLAVRGDSPERQIAISVQDCRLRYPLGDSRASFKSSLFSMFRPEAERRICVDYVEALRGVSMDIFRGERVALIGQNGSGKSTLLRTIAGIYPLAGGRVRVSGETGTMLELGLGFEPDATGRENIYHCGLATGHSESALKAAEAEIVEFCELGDFIDLPTRTYSAGMHVRLAFAIATQFTPDVSLVDEVFGAGDAGFAKRAVKRMLAMVERSGTFVIATHDMGLVRRLCTRAVWLSAGSVVADGEVTPVVDQYLASVNQ